MGTLHKEAEFEEFVEILKDSVAYGHWTEIARALGVSNDTITAWKRRPEAQKAIKEAIKRSLTQMEKSGSKDWRMWEAKLKMLGVNPSVNINANIQSDPIEELLRAYGIVRSTDDRQADEALPSPSSRET